MLPRDHREALSADTGGDDRLAHRQGLEDPEPRASPDPQGHHVDGGLGLYGRTSGTVPVTLTPAAFTRSVGFRPTTVSETSETSWRIVGRIASMKWTIASSLGYQSIDPVKTSVAGLRLGRCVF
jgi:hypothetical protein